MSKHGYCTLMVLLLCGSPFLGCDKGKSLNASASYSIALNNNGAKADTEGKKGAILEEKTFPAKQEAYAKATAPTPLKKLSAESTGPIQDVHVGSPAWEPTPYGYFVYFVPSKEPPKGMAVLVHGTIKKDGDGMDPAKGCIDGFVEVAQQQNLMLVAPAFNDPDYGGFAGPVGGYRGLVGRVVSADTFLNSCVDRVLATFPNLNPKFYLYGDESGGQFASRYIIKHPDRVQAAVLCRSHTYAFPSPDVTWTNGMARLQRMVRWSDQEPYTTMDYTPDPQGWINATQLPVAVVVGALDTSPIKTVEGQPGQNTVERARNYVREMNDYALKQGVESRVRLVEVKGVGSSYSRLLPASIAAMFAQDAP